jgi:rSAM/selenodomain-associated transferase 1
MPVQIALVAKVPIAGIVKTRLAPMLAPSESASLYEAMLTDTMRTLAHLGHPVIVFYAPAEGRGRIESIADNVRGAMPGTGSSFTFVPQAEGDLGERLTALASVLLPNGPVIFLGADCPHAPTVEINRAVAGLADHDVVIGPAEDGGYWLIGISSEQPELFRAMPWSTPRVLAKTRKRADRLTLKRLEVATGFDVDDADSVHRLAMRLSAEPDLARRLPRTTASLIDLGMIAED